MERFRSAALNKEGSPLSSKAVGSAEGVLRFEDRYELLRPSELEQA
jgi:hypothetical protein